MIFKGPSNPSSSMILLFSKSCVTEKPNFPACCGAMFMSAHCNCRKGKLLAQIGNSLAPERTEQTKHPHSNPEPVISSIPSESLLSILLTYELGALLYIRVKK